MKNTNKTLTVLLSLLLALSACLPLCAVANAEAAVIAGGECGRDGDNLTWTLTDDGVLTISGEGEMADFGENIEDANFAPWKAFAANSVIISALGYPDWASLKADLDNGTANYAAYFAAAYNFNFGYFSKVVIEENVTSAGAYAFYGMNVTEVQLPSTLRTIGKKAFASNRLTHIELPQELSEICTGAFDDNDLTEVVLSPSTQRANDFLNGNDNLQKLTIVDRYDSISGIHIPTVNVALPFTDFDTFAAYRDLKDAVDLGEDVYNLSYTVSYVLSALMRQKNWTETQARDMMTASETYQIRVAADKLGIDLSDPGAITAKINSILGTSFTEAEIFMTGPVFVPDTDLAYAVYPSGSNPNPGTYTDYMLLNCLGTAILFKNYYNPLPPGVSQANFAAALNDFYATLAQLGVTASTPADAVTGILARLNADLGLTGNDAYTEATAGTLNVIRGGVSAAVENAILAKFGVSDLRVDTEVRWYYGINDHASGFSSDPEIEPAPWFTIKLNCDHSDVEMLEAEGISLELVHDPVQHEGQAPTCGAAGWEPYETCTKCDYTSYTPIAPTGNHTWGEWEISQPATYTAAGQKTRECTVCHTPDYGEVPVLEPVASDGDTGISLSFDPSAYEGEVELTVSQVFDGDSFAIVSQLAGSFAPVLYDITTLVNGEAAQPQAPVTVSIPLPAGFDPAHTFIYHVTDDGAMVPVDFEYDAGNGTLTFTASHFSVYAVVDQTPVNTGEPSAEEPPAGEPGDQTAEQPAGSPSFFSKIIDFLNKIINIFRNLFNR